MRTLRTPSSRVHAHVVLALAGATGVIAPRAHAQDASSSPPPSDPVAPPSSSPPPADEATSSSAPPPSVDDASTTPPPSASSEPPSTPPSLPPLPEPAVSASPDHAFARIPGATTVIDTREITATQPFTLSEVLRRVPGVYVRDEDGMGLRLNVGMRGFDPTNSHHVQVLEDGMPIALMPYGASDTIYAPPVERVQRIEVTRGSGGLLFGPTTQGGTINFVGLSPTAQETIHLRAFGGLPLYGGGEGFYSNTFGSTGVLFQVVRRQGVGLRNNAFEVTDALAKLRVQIGPRSDLTARFSAYDEGSNTSTVGLTQAMFDNAPSQNPTPFDWTRVRRYAASLTYDYRITDSVRLRALLFSAMTQYGTWRQLYDRDPVANLAYASIFGDVTRPGGALYLRDANTYSQREFQMIGFEPRLQAGFRIANFRNEVDLGARLELERSFTDIQLGHAQWARSGDELHSESYEGFAVAAHLQDRFFVTDALQFTPAVRVESWNYTRTIRRDAGVDMYLPGAGSAVLVLPGANLTYALPDFAVWTGVHLGFTPPRVEQAIDPFTHHANEPEQSITYEIGVRGQLGGWLRGDAALFYIDYQNPLVYGLFPDGSGTGWYPGDPRRHVGGEVSGQADFGRLAGISTRIYVGARYMFVDARYVSGVFAGNLVPYAPPHTFTGIAGFEHPLGFSAEASVHFVSDHASDPANTPMASLDGTLGPIPAFATVDVLAGYSHRDTGLGITLAAKNLLDTPYVASRAPDGISPGGFRSVILSVRWNH